LDLNEPSEQAVVEQIVVVASFRLVLDLLAVLRRLHLAHSPIKLEFKARM
jgi:hypothetical protein